MTQIKKRRTKAELEEARRGIEWKANLYALTDEIIKDAQAGDPMCREIIAKTTLGPLVGGSRARS
ncbi:hypothetical protein AX279_22495 [Pseudomonas sp. J237]|nr:MULTISPECIES: hypothetical protein [Pseudomonas]OEO23097.1 hypothetical protein AX279_22495 [Pseudomonas sp. J237]